MSDEAKFVPWAEAGGPNECKHGYAAGIPCPQCAKAAPQPPGAAMRVDDETIAEAINEMQGSSIQDRAVNRFIADLLADRAEMVREIARLREERDRIVGIVQMIQPAGSPPPYGPEMFVNWIVRAAAVEMDRLRNLEWKFPHKLDVEPDGSLWKHDDVGLRRCSREEVVAWLNRFGQLERENAALVAELAEVREQAGRMRKVLWFYSSPQTDLLDGGRRARAELACRKCGKLHAESDKCIARPAASTAPQDVCENDTMGL